MYLFLHFVKLSYKNERQKDYNYGKYTVQIIG